MAKVTTTPQVRQRKGGGNYPHIPGTGDQNLAPFTGTEFNIGEKDKKPILKAPLNK